MKHSVREYISACSFGYLLREASLCVALFSVIIKPIFVGSHTANTYTHVHTYKKQHMADPEGMLFCHPKHWSQSRAEPNLTPLFCFQSDKPSQTFQRGLSLAGIMCRKCWIRTGERRVQVPFSVLASCLWNSIPFLLNSVKSKRLVYWWKSKFLC